MNNRKEINDFIHGLQYDPHKVLAFHGNTVPDKDSKEGRMEDGQYMVIERQKCSLKTTFDTSVPAINKSITYPGALLIADSKLVDGNPNTVGVKRGGVKLTLDLPGMTYDNSAIVECADYASISGEMNRILNIWYNTYPAYTSIPADMSLISDMVYDEKEMQLKYGIDAKFLENTVGIDFNAIRHKKKSVFIARFKQIYYTASIAPIAEAADAFADGVTVEDLKHAGIGNDTPPAYVGAVAYGREVFVKFESKLQGYELEALVKGSISEEGITAEGGYSGKSQELSKKVSCSVIALGGGSETMECLFSDKDKIEALNMIIRKGIKLDINNPAFPLTYKTVFLKENKTATLHGMSEYVQEHVSIYDKGELVVEHNGVYVARFEISWDEIIDYDQNGKAVVKHVKWGENGKHKTLGYQTVIPLSGNVRNIHIKAEGATGLVWDPWNTSFDEHNIPLRPKLTFKISGTTLNQKAELATKKEE